MAEVEETLRRIQSQKGVQGIVIVNSEGIPIKTTLDNSSTVQYAGLIHQLVMKARSTVRDIDPQNDLTFLRIRSKKNEIMIAPDKDYFLIVIQNPSDWSWRTCLPLITLFFLSLTNSRTEFSKLNTSGKYRMFKNLLYIKVKPEFEGE